MSPPQATVGTIRTNVPKQPEVVPLAPTTRISDEEKSGSPVRSAESTSPVQTQSTGSTSTAPTPSGDSIRTHLPWLRKRIADSANTLGIYGSSASGFPTEHM
ncbi:hypothetical protein NW754_016275 [Fusarium falciforme]|nr:hypothetical protein NW754_016275 [Fusarium falciforme]